MPDEIQVPTANIFVTARYWLLWGPDAALTLEYLVDEALTIGFQDDDIVPEGQLLDTQAEVFCIGTQAGDLRALPGAIHAGKADQHRLFLMLALEFFHAALKLNEASAPWREAKPPSFAAIS